MKRRCVFLAGVLLGVPFLLGTGLQAQGGQTNPDSVYGKTPERYRPYSRFVEEPYKRFFLDVLEYPGYGRELPEPERVETVKIGFIGPIIGSTTESRGGPQNVEQRVNERQTRWDGYQISYLSPLGLKMLHGAQLAVQQANERGGYRGEVPYELVVRNDNGVWRSAGRTAIDLAYRDSVWAILGTVDGANSHILIRVALKAEIPVMNTADTDPTFVETAIPWVFRNITDDRAMCYLLADVAFRVLGLKRIAAVRAVNRYGRVSIDEFRDAATRLGNPFMAELQYQEGDTNFRPQLERIKSLNVDGVITYGNSKESALLLRQMREMGLDQWFFASDRAVTQEFIDIVGPKPGRVIAGYPYDPTSEAPRHVQFLNDYRARYEETPGTYAAHAYDGMNMLIEAIARAGLNRALIRDSLVAMKTYEGVTGMHEFDAVFSDRSPAYLAVLKDGRFEFYSEEEVLSGQVDLGSVQTGANEPPGVLDTPVDFSGWEGVVREPSEFDEIRVGMFAPQDGDDPIAGPVSKAAALAIEQINAAGGFRGVPIRLVQRWVADPWRGGAKEMTKLVYEDSVWAVIGSVSGADTHVAEQVVTKARVPLMSPIAADPTLTYIRIPWMFRLPPDDGKQAEVIARQGLEAASLHHVGLVTSTDHDGRTFAGEMLERMHAERVPIAFHFQVSAGDHDLDDVVRRAGAFQPDGIIVRLPLAETLDLVERFQREGFAVPLFIPWIPGMRPADLTARYRGAIRWVEPFSESENPAFAAFAREYRARYGGEPTPSAAYAFDAVSVLVQSLRESGLNRSRLRDAIAGLSGFQGVTGTIAWDNGGGSLAEPLLRQVSEVSAAQPR